MGAPTTHLELACGCLVGEEGPVVLCPTADRLARRTNDLIPPYGDDDAHSWGVFHRELEEYRRHVRTS